MSQPRYPMMLNYYHYELNEHNPSLRRSEPSGTESSASVDVLLGNLSLRASLQSDLLAADCTLCQIDCPNTNFHHQAIDNQLTNSIATKMYIEKIPECVPCIKDTPVSNVQADNHINQNIASSLVMNLQTREVQKKSSLSMDYDQDFGRENIIDKHVRLPDWDLRAVEQPIENEEWVVFLQRSMEEVMDGEDGSLLQQNCVSVFVSPLRNPAAGSQVIEYVACLLALPFVVQTSFKKLEDIKRVYLDVRVVPNLVYAMKLLMMQEQDDEAAAETAIRSASTLSADELQAIECTVLLLCRLVYVQEHFLTQFCDAVYIVSGIPLLQQLMTLEKRKPRVVAYLVAILNNVLRSQPENAELVERVVLRIKCSGNLKIYQIQANYFLLPFTEYFLNGFTLL